MRLGAYQRFKELMEKDEFDAASKMPNAPDHAIRYCREMEKKCDDIGKGLMADREDVYAQWIREGICHA